MKDARARKLKRIQALCLETAGDCHLDLGAPDKALKSFQSSLKIGLEIAPEGDLVAEAYRRLGETFYAQREFEKAERAVTEGWRIAEKLHNDMERVGLLRVKANIALERNDLDTTDGLFREAADVCMRRGFRYEHALTLEQHAFAHLTTGRVETGQPFLASAMAVYEDLRIHRAAIRLRRSERGMSRARPPTPPESPVILERALRWESFGIYTRSPEFLDQLEDLPEIAALGGPVLIVGETGVGKELVAKAVHVLSRRRGRFVDINCAAIPHTMLESELFGSRRGAYTGAENRHGLAAVADGGTLFLDEIGDMPRRLQAKLLRFLESSSYRAVGSTEVLNVSVRLVSATNASLTRSMDAGRFRMDLYYRIKGTTVVVPPLRVRKPDIEFLAYHFLRQACTARGRSLPVIDSIAMGRMMEYDWPGNVRELRHAIVNALVPLRQGSRITATMLPVELREHSTLAALKRMSAADLIEEIHRYGGNMSKLAIGLGVGRQTLYRRLAELGVDIASLRQ